VQGLEKQGVKAKEMEVVEVVARVEAKAEREEVDEGVVLEAREPRAESRRPWPNRHGKRVGV
jgi:hypothetical protein